MTLVERAHEIAKKAHEGQVDSQKKPYITHPEFVASLCETDEEKIVAYCLNSSRNNHIFN